MDKSTVLQWYNDNNIIDIIEEEPCNHFLLKKNKSPALTSNTAVAALPNMQKQVVKTEIKIQNKVQIKTENSAGEKIEFKRDETVKFTIENNNFNSIYQNLANKYRNDNMRLADNSINSFDKSLADARELADKADTVENLKNAVENFDGYLDIKKLATNTVFGEGDVKAKIMIVGEAPGNNEDLEGRPFCGQSGELLEGMFKAIGISREELYITNTLFWRPPGNRTPTEEEVAICRPFVEKHIALINPKLIVFMGSTALKGLIATPLTITKARKQLFEYTNQYLDGKIINTTPMFHPSYMLRQANKKKDAWEDLLFVKNIVSSL